MQRVGATLLQCLTGSDDDVKHQMGPYFTWKLKKCEGMFREKYCWIGYPIDTSANINLTKSWFLGSSTKICKLECWTMANYLVKEM